MLDKMVIPHSEFLPEFGRCQDNQLKFRKCISLNRGVSPFKKTYIPFYEQLSAQITALLKLHTFCNIIRYYDFRFYTQAFTCEGDPYVQRIILPYTQETIDRISNVYRARFYQLHYDGYAYGRLAADNKIGLHGSVDIWIRWKSHLPNYEYIEPNDELNLKSEDITFELCDQICDDLTMRFYGKTADEVDCHAWIEFLNDKKHFPRKSSKKSRNIPFEVSSNCIYPDVTFSLYFNQSVTEDLKNLVVSEFTAFQEEWDSKHISGIHDMVCADESDNVVDKHVIKITVDFGNCNPKIVEKLIKYLENSDLEINKIIVE